MTKSKMVHRRVFCGRFQHSKTVTGSQLKIAAVPVYRSFFFLKHTPRATIRKNEGMVMEKLIVRPRNPNDIHLDEAEALAQLLRPVVPEISVEVEGQEQLPGHFGVTWFQIIELVVPTVASPVLGEILKAAIEWARSRFKKKEGTQRRPVYVPIYGPDGEILKSVLVKNAVDEPEDRTEEDRNRQKGTKQN
ncbi:MAG: hypothetical protein ABSB33_00690 [Tepidisphaeraceae bacterium]